MEIAQKTEKQSSTILKTWQDNGMLESEDYHSERFRRKTAGLKVNRAKLAENGQTIPQVIAWTEDQLSSFSRR